MQLRDLRPEDVAQLRAIHEKFYKDEFTFPDFFNGYVCAFASVNDEGCIISAGGVRPILESVIITDKSYSVRVRRAALYGILSASNYITERAGYKEIHAFIQDESWLKCLQKIGFRNTAGVSLVLSIADERG